MTTEGSYRRKTVSTKANAQTTFRYHRSATEEKVEQLKQDSEVQEGLDKAATQKEAVIIPAKSKQRLFLGTYSVILLVLRRVAICLGLAYPGSVKST